MNDYAWVRITAHNSIPLREGRTVTVAGREIAIFNLGYRVLAIDNRCPHRAGPLSDGIVTGTSVVCPLHGWRVALQTGAVERPAGTSACVETYPVRIDNGVIVVGLPSDFVDRDRRDQVEALAEEIGS